MKRFFIAVIFTVFLLFQNLSGFTYDFEIKSYRMNIDVQSDKTLNIKENIGVYFPSQKHGIVRTIPKTGTINYSNKKKKTYNAKLSDLSSNRMYSLTTDEKNYSIKMGNPTVFIEGNQDFKINYSYRVPPKKFDDFYFNLIGPEWESPISDFTFTIKMPKKFNTSKIYFYDINGDTKNVEYTVNANVISGKITKQIPPNFPYTIHIHLPVNYFDVTLWDYLQGYIMYLPFIIPFLVLLHIFYLWYKYGKDEKTYVTVEFEPPENYNSVEIAYLYRQYIGYQDISTILIHLANKGYIKIEEDEKGRYTITKLKNCDSEKVSERKFMNALFGNNITINEKLIKENVKLYKIVQNISENIEKSFKKLFEASSLEMQKQVSILMAFSWVIVSIYLYIGYLRSLEIWIIFWLIGFTGGCYFIFSQELKNAKFNPLKMPFFTGFLPLLGVIFSIVWMVSVNRELLIPLLFTLLCIIGMDIFKHLMTKWSVEGNKLHGKVLGFKNFLEKAEKEKLQKLVEKDPMYFYKIIPYAYVFGISSKWFKKFEDIACPVPEYYSGKEFNSRIFNNLTNSLTDSMVSNSAESSSGGGSFGSGGGSAGGGFGGGGGHSW